MRHVAPDMPKTITGRRFGKVAITPSMIETNVVYNNLGTSCLLMSHKRCGGDFQVVGRRVPASIASALSQHEVLRNDGLFGRRTSSNDLSRGLLVRF